MIYDAVITGSGVAGLTAAAYLSRSGFRVLVCEKEERIGGLVNSFQYQGFTFDGGIRAFENSGIVFPMLRQLGLKIDFVKNNVSIGIEQDVIHLRSKDSLEAYQAMLQRQFPDHTADIQKIIGEVRRVMRYMEVLYGIDNPLFLDLRKDRDYLLKTILPWMPKFAMTIGKIEKLNTPIEEYLRQMTANTALIDMIAQHFFQKTPAFFALSYFSLYLDYQYPKGGTGVLIDHLEQFIVDHQGTIRTSTQICDVNPQEHTVTDTGGNVYGYKKLIWASDLKQLYRMLDIDAIPAVKSRAKAARQKAAVLDKTGGDSVLTLFLALDLDKRFFEAICTAHFFYTPFKQGLSGISPLSPADPAAGQAEPLDQQATFDWVRQYLRFTTYEISCPVMRDESLAPPGQTGLIISTLFDYTLVSQISDKGWYEAFKEISMQTIIDVLDETIFPGIKSKMIGYLLSTPLTMAKRTGNSEGAITGWAFTNNSIPAIHHLPQVAKAVLTPIPDILQAGQWTYSPSGLPISVLTGKLAADRAIKQLKSKR